MFDMPEWIRRLIELHCRMPDSDDPLGLGPFWGWPW
jgi:hypothetical protein